MDDYNLETSKRKKFISRFEPKQREADRPQQLDMSLKESPVNRFFKVKRSVTKIEDRMRFSYFWRSFWIWLTIFTGFTATAIALLYLQKYWNGLPADVPLFGLFNTAKNKLGTKFFLLIIAFVPFISTVISLIFFYILFRNYERLKILIFQLVLMISIFTMYGIFSIVKIY